jgi:hypothetical protein
VRGLDGFSVSRRYALVDTPSISVLLLRHTEQDVQSILEKVSIEYATLDLGCEAGAAMVKRIDELY